MYRAHRWNAATKRVYRESGRVTSRALLQKELDLNQCFSRSNTVSAGRGTFSLLRFAISGVLATGAGIGAAVFYAGRDEKIRNELEKVPFAPQVLLSIYGKQEKHENLSDDPEHPLAEQNLERSGNEESLLRPILKTSTDNSEVKEAVIPVIDEDNTLAVEEQTENKIVVITTIDDQAAVSSVDLDISNASTQTKKKKKAKKKKTDKAEKQPSQEEEVEVISVKKASEEIVVASSSAAEEAVAVQGDKGTPMNVSAESPQGSIIPPPIEAAVTNEIETSVGEPPVDDAKDDNSIVDRSTKEDALRKHMEELKLAQDSAIEKHAYVSEKLKQYGDQLVKVMSLERESLKFDDEWKAASDLEHTSQGLIDEAKDSELNMQGHIDAMYKLIQDLRESGSSELINLAQETATKASLALINATEKVRKDSENILELSEKYLVKEEDVQKELSPLLDGMVTMKQGNTAPESAAFSSSVILTYAMKKIEFLKNDLENLRIKEEKKLEEMIQKVKEEEEKNTELKLATQEEILKRDFEVLVQKKEADLLEEFEIEMRKQLKRQSAAHREHLSDVLDAHTLKLSAEHKTEMEENLRRERLLHGNELAKVSSHLRGVESLVDSISNVERNTRKTRELWLAVQSLNAVLNEDIFSGRTKNLWPEIVSIAKLAENNETVQFVLETIPESAAVDGVTTEEGLKKRFQVVKRICKRVAMVDDNGSLWTYLLSAIRSLLVFETHAKRDIVKEVDPEAINPYEILAKAQHCVEEGDLELAVKFMSLLKGLPRQLAQDWLREARVYLETKQASEFLLAYLASEASCDQNS